MKLTAEKVSMWAGIFSLLPTAGWLLTHGQSLASNVEVSSRSSSSYWPTVFGCLFFVSFATMVIANYVANRDTPNSSRPSPGNDPGSTGTSGPPEYLKVNDFYRTYDNSFLQEIENLIRQMAKQYEPGNERESYLIRAAATIFATALFENTWAIIGKSQLRALVVLNTKPLTLDELRPYYDEGKKSRPDFYEANSLTFDRWVDTGKELGFVVQTGQTVQITVRGREFLKYLTHRGYDIDSPFRSG